MPSHCKFSYLGLGMKSQSQGEWPDAELLDRFQLFVVSGADLGPYFVNVPGSPRSLIWMYISSGAFRGGKTISN
jgi:hypothetical protein